MKRIVIYSHRLWSTSDQHHWRAGKVLIVVIECDLSWEQTSKTDSLTFESSTMTYEKKSRDPVGKWRHPQTTAVKELQLKNGNTVSVVLCTLNVGEYTNVLEFKYVWIKINKYHYCVAPLLVSAARVCRLGEKGRFDSALAAQCTSKNFIFIPDWKKSRLNRGPNADHTLYERGILNINMSEYAPAHP